MDTKTYPVGTIISADITSDNANTLKDFYTQVVGWQTEDMKMSDEAGEYADYIVKDQSGNPVGGVCHKRGQNNDLPMQWIMYVNVENVTKSIETCIALGGKVLKEQKNEDGTCSYALVQDPIGAIFALTKV